MLINDTVVWLGLDITSFKKIKRFALVLMGKLDFFLKIGGHSRLFSLLLTNDNLSALFTKI